MQKVLVITANLSGMDQSTIKHMIQDLDNKYLVSYIEYTDDNFPPRVNSISPRLQAKIPKMLAWECHPNHDMYIWIDGSYVLSHSKSILNLGSKMFSSNFSIVRHWQRSCIKDEYDFVVEQMNSGDNYLISRYQNELMGEQVNAYLSDPNFKDNILLWGGLFSYSRELVEAKPEFFREWYYHCARYSVQDQLSLPYLLYKHKISPQILDVSYKNENLTSLTSHRKK